MPILLFKKPSQGCQTHCLKDSIWKVLSPSLLPHQAMLPLLKLSYHFGPLYTISPYSQSFFASRKCQFFLIPSFYARLSMRQYTQNSSLFDSAALSLSIPINRHHNVKLRDFTKRLLVDRKPVIRYSPNYVNITEIVKEAIWCYWCLVFPLVCLHFRPILLCVEYCKER